MRHPVLSATIACLFVFTICVAPAFAAETHTGKVKSVDHQDNKLVLTVDDKDHTFKVDQNARITINGERAQLRDLKEGQTATVMASEVNGENVATSISSTAPQNE